MKVIQYTGDEHANKGPSEGKHKYEEVKHINPLMSNAFETVANLVMLFRAPT